MFRKELPRPLVGLGHSMGGNHVVNLALMHPRLLSGLILIDPVIQEVTDRKGNLLPAQLSTYRRDTWASREEAEGPHELDQTVLFMVFEDRFVLKYECLV